MTSKNKKKNKKNQHRRTRRKFTPEFRTDVVRLCRSGSESISEVCRRLDLTESAVRGWVAKADAQAVAAAPTSTLTVSELDEFQRLRRENKQLKMERDILKKAVTFFAKEST